MSRTFLVVHGVVQGVGYRAFVAQQAQRLSVKGFVRNMSDGSVEILAEAAPETLASFIDSIKSDIGQRHQVFAIDFRNERLKEFDDKNYKGFEFIHGKFPAHV